jgi:hypothetical protein
MKEPWWVQIQARAHRVVNDGDIGVVVLLLTGALALALLTVFGLIFSDQIRHVVIACAIVGGAGWAWYVFVRWVLKRLAEQYLARRKLMNAAGSGHDHD